MGLTASFVPLWASCESEVFPRQLRHQDMFPTVVWLDSDGTLYTYTSGGGKRTSPSSRWLRSTPNARPASRRDASLAPRRRRLGLHMRPHTEAQSHVTFLRVRSRSCAPPHRCQRCAVFHRPLRSVSPTVPMVPRWFLGGSSMIPRRFLDDSSTIPRRFLDDPSVVPAFSRRFPASPGRSEDQPRRERGGEGGVVAGGIDGADW